MYLTKLWKFELRCESRSLCSKSKTPTQKRLGVKEPLEHIGETTGIVSY